MATETTLTLPNEVKTFYDRTLLDRAVPMFVHGQFGQIRPLPKGIGKTIEFRRFSNLTAATTPLTEGTTPAGTNLTVTIVTATVAQYGDFVTGSDMLELTAIDPILTETSMVQGDQAGDTIDQIVREVVVAGTNLQYAAGRASRVTVTATDTMKVAEIRKAVRTLKRANARRFADGYYVAIVHPDASFDLMGDTDWVQASVYAGSTQIFDGEIGRIHGVRFVESTNAKKYAGAGAAGVDVFGAMFFGQNAYGIVPLEGMNLQSIFKPVGSSGAADPLNQRWSMGWKVGFAAKILNDLFMLRLEHGATA
jgi:N4-gp56 family major capsid protein